jgi:hypothetical protein
MINLYKSYLSKILIIGILSIFLLLSFVVTVSFIGTTYIPFDNWKRSNLDAPLLNDIYKNLEKQEYYIVFGTSRTNAMSEKTFGSDTINLSSYVYGNPISVDKFLKTLSKKQVKNIKRIYYALDIKCFQKDRYLVDYEKFTILSFIFNQLKNISKESISKSIGDVLLNLGYIENNFYLSKNGNVIALKDKRFDGRFINGRERLKGKTYYLANLKNVDDFAKKNNIEIIYFSPIFSGPYIQHDLDKDFIYGLYKDILEVINNMYFFFYIEDISNDLSLFSDYAHLSIKETDKFYSDKKKWNKYLINSDLLKGKVDNIWQKISKIKPIKIGKVITTYSIKN